MISNNGKPRSSKEITKPVKNRTTWTNIVVVLNETIKKGKQRQANVVVDKSVPIDLSELNLSVVALRGM